MTIKNDSYYTQYTIRLKSHLISVESYRILSRFHVINSSVIVIFKLSEFNHMYFFLYIDRLNFNSYKDNILSKFGIPNLVENYISNQS